MKYRLNVRPEASADIAEAFSWYEGQRPTLGAEFESEVDRALDLIRQMPNAGRVVHRSLRRALLRRFPFSIYYTASSELIAIRAVLHHSRDPRTWQRRA